MQIQDATSPEKKVTCWKGCSETVLASTLANHAAPGHGPEDCPMTVHIVKPFRLCRVLAQANYNSARHCQGMVQELTLVRDHSQ